MQQVSRRQIRLIAFSLAASCFFAVYSTAQAASPCPFVWTSTLQTRSTGAAVLKLQQFLNTDTTTIIVTSGAGSPGKESSTFGALTKAALIRFQEKYAADILTPNGLQKGTGIVGASTRAKLNALCAGPSVQLPTSASETASTSAPVLTVTETQQPAATIMPANSLNVPFTSFTLTAGAADVEVNGVTVERVGPGSDAMFYDVDLENADQSFASTAYFDTTHHATFRDTFTVPAHTSETFTLYGDAGVDLTDEDGQMAGLQLDSIDASAPVIGSLPVRGTLQTANATLLIGTVTADLSALDPGAAQTHYIGDKNITFSGIRLTAGSQEDISFGSITWEQDGSAAASDIANITTVVDGVAYPATSSDGRFYTSTFPTPLTIGKGNSLDVSVRGDLLSTGSNRTVQFDVNRPTDINVSGQTYGYGIFVLPGGHTDVSGNSVFLTQDGTPDTTNLTPFFSASPVTVNPGGLMSISSGN